MYNMLNKFRFLAFCSLLALAHEQAIAASVPEFGPPVSTDANKISTDGLPTHADGFVANRSGLQGLFNALASKLGKPIIVSQTARRKEVSGNFDFDNPWGALEQISQQMGLIWYFDGQSVFVYDSSEMKSSVKNLMSINVTDVVKFLKNAGLYDKRYPLKGSPKGDTFYISGPPVYVDSVLTAAQMMDKRYEHTDLITDKIGIINLQNTFVDDRTYQLRGSSVTIPGICTVLQQILQAGPVGTTTEVLPAGPPSGAPQTVPTLASSSNPVPNNSAPTTPSNVTSAPLPGSSEKQFQLKVNDQLISVVAFTETNSLLIKGTPDQIQLVKDLVKQLDVPKRHVQLSLWIIDIEKGFLNQLGVDWTQSNNSGQITFGNNTTFSSSVKAATLLAQIHALDQEGKANIVTHPVLLTQENVPAVFDNNTSFYASLKSQYAAQLQQVTYGTSISVLPRISGDDSQVEMVLNVQDGSANNSTDNVNGLPTVNNTAISTVARVIKGDSLLVGGYTLAETGDKTFKVPLLGDIPLLGTLFSYKEKGSADTARLFLIEPSVLPNDVGGFTPDQFSSPENPGTTQSKASVIRMVDKLNQYLDNDEPSVAH